MPLNLTATVLPLLLGILVSGSALRSAPAQDTAPKAVAPKAAKPKATVAKPKATQVSPPPVAAPAPPKSTVPRWICTIDVRGKTTRTWGATLKGQAEQRSVTEDFSYSIPGFLTETTDPGGAVAFEFVADESRKGDRRARAMMMDATTRAGITKNIVVDSDNITSVPVWRFEASGRGQRIFPAKVEVMLQGTQANAPVSMVAAKIAPSRPIYSIPMMDARTAAIDFTAPALEFQGLALWALANAKGAFTASANVTYRDTKIQGFQKLNGVVVINFNFSGLAR